MKQILVDLILLSIKWSKWLITLALGVQDYVRKWKKKKKIQAIFILKNKKN